VVLLSYLCVHAMADSLDLFPAEKYATRSEVEHKEAMEKFKAAVMASRSGNDDSIKQVRVLLCLDVHLSLFLNLFNKPGSLFS